MRRRCRDELDRRPLGGGDALGADIARFLADQERLKKYSVSSMENRTFILQDFAHFACGIPTAMVSAAVLQKYYDSKRWKENKEERLAASTCESYIMMVRAFFKWTIKKRIRSHNPCADLVMERVSKKTRLPFCTREQVRQLIRECPREDLKFCLLAGFHCGLRTMEIVESKASWFDLQAGMLHLKKHEGIHFKDREERSVPMTNEFVEFVQAYAPTIRAAQEKSGLGDPYMLRPDVVRGKSLYRYDFDRPFRNYVAAKGMAWVTPKIMRHTFASLLASHGPDGKGTSIYKIAVWMGDDVRVVQNNYAKLLPDRSTEGTF